MGRRKNDFAQTVCASVYDIDHNRTFDSVVEQREREGCVGMTHTSYSHGKTMTLLDAGKGMEWLQGRTEVTAPLLSALS